jgi:malate synthase
MIFPDRQQITMTVPFMKNYCDKIVDVCHKRGAHAMGGMSAFIPDRKEPEITASAIEKVRADKLREVTTGFDGTWVAHPDLIPVAREEFVKVLGSAPHQKHKVLGRQYSDQDLGDTYIPNAQITEAGVRSNLFVALVYIDHWINGTGAVAIHNLMEDAATAEISRSQLWQWIHHKVTLNDGLQISKPLIEKWLVEEGEKANQQGLLKSSSQSAKALSELIFTSEFAEFLTLKCEHLIRGGLDDKH